MYPNRPAPPASGSQAHLSLLGAQHPGATLGPLLWVPEAALGSGTWGVEGNIATLAELTV